MMESDLILIHGLFCSAGTKFSDVTSRAYSRAEAVAAHGEAVGVRHYEWIDGGKKSLANRLLRLARGTARAVDALEILELDPEALRVSLADQTIRDFWRKMASCEVYGFDSERSFILIGRQRQLLSGARDGQRVLWFGNGISKLSEAEFVAHYTGRHGPLVAENAQSLGVCWYRQVASEQNALCDSLRALGLGQASPPAVFAELAMGSPRLDLTSLRARRLATRAIKADEKRHIDFSRSMLLLA